MHDRPMTGIGMNVSRRMMQSLYSRVAMRGSRRIRRDIYRDPFVPKIVYERGSVRACWDDPAQILPMWVIVVAVSWQPLQYSPSCYPPPPSWWWVYWCSRTVHTVARTIPI